MKKDSSHFGHLNNLITPPTAKSVTFFTQLADNFTAAYGTTTATAVAFLQAGASLSLKIDSAQQSTDSTTRSAVPTVDRTTQLAAFKNMKNVKSLTQPSHPTQTITLVTHQHYLNGKTGIMIVSPISRPPFAIVRAHQKVFNIY